MARMLDQLMVEDGHSVLEIGAGTGYNAALLSQLAGPGGTVTSVDLDSGTARLARRNLLGAGFDKVRVVEADGWMGAPERGPFDRIVMTVGVWDISPHWVRQLRRGGILLVPLWLRGGFQVSVAFTTDDVDLSSVSVRPCAFMRLRGPHAGPEGYLGFHGWTASLDLSAHAAPILALVKAQPSVHEVPELARHPAGWFPRFLLDEPGAMSVVKEIDKAPSVGLFHPTQRSLALLDGDRVLLFGNDDALAPLVQGSVRARPLDAETLQVAASPASDEVNFTETSVWTVTRPNYWFAISGGTPVGAK